MYPMTRCQCMVGDSKQLNIAEFRWQSLKDIPLEY